MPKVFAIGETIYDIIFEHGQPVAARPGGSMLNTAVSLGRCGLDVEMITEIGQDQVGQTVMEFLASNRVGTSFTLPVKGFKTPVALAFLDENGNASYSFYFNYPEKRLSLIWPEPAKGDVVLFGAFYSLDPAIHHNIKWFVKTAKLNGAFIVYDPNIRKSHLGEIQRHMGFVEENIAMANIVRGSDEDFVNLFRLGDVRRVYHRIRDLGCKYLIYTRNSQGADVYTHMYNSHFPAKEVKVVSTIGAGDSFNAGIIYGLINGNFTNRDAGYIGAKGWDEILDYGINFAADVCGSYDNYISEDLIRKDGYLG